MLWGLVSLIVFLSVVLPPAEAATAAQWRNRSIYQQVSLCVSLPCPHPPPGSSQIATHCPLVPVPPTAILETKHGVAAPGIPFARILITFRKQASLRVSFCLPVPSHNCADMAYLSIVWISPVNKNYDGPRTQYGDAYTGYWVTDVSQLNPRFGTADDLKQLSAELHRRGMYLMVDLVLNNVMATSTTPDYSGYFFKVCAILPLHASFVYVQRFSLRIHHNTIHTVPYSGGTELAKWIAGLATLWSHSLT